MDEQDKKLVSRARTVASRKSYLGWEEIPRMGRQARSPEARKAIKDILTELHHREEASVGDI